MMSVIQVDDGRSRAPPNPKPHRTKRSVACNYCRLKKVRCNGEQPTCANCLDRGEQCVYLIVQRKNRRESRASSEFMLDRIARMEALLKEANVVGGQQQNRDAVIQLGSEKTQMQNQPHNQIEDENANHLPPSPPHTNHSAQSISWSPKDSANIDDCFRRGSNTSMIQPVGDIYATRTVSSPSAARGIMTDQETHNSWLLPRINNIDSVQPPTGTVTPMVGEESEGLAAGKDKSVGSIAPPQNQHWEYHGPGSFLSICSKPGIDWVDEKAGVSDFAEIARTFSREIARPLKLDQKINPERFPEPDRDTAWRYSQTYFEKCPEALFDLVNRSSFETRLHAHFEKLNIGNNEDDAAWYALRNIVYAFGARAELGRASASSNFVEAQAAGWRYFENALSKHTELTFCKTGLMAVQALATMAFYVEGVGCPSLEYMLCSTAVRLAQSKGLHRQPGTAWGMTPQEIQQRNWMFWILYSYEKQVAQRAGRASAIDDDDISCQVPTAIPVGSSNNLEFATHMITHAQISSQIGKRFSTVQAYRQSPEEIVKTACELDQQLRDWRKTLPQDLRPGHTMNLSKETNSLQIDHKIYLHYQYFGSLIGIHSTFTYPWSGIMFGRGRAQALRNQVTISTEIVAEASRSIILATKYINDIHCCTPCWMAFYFPILGLINLFVHVLKYPTAPTAQSDIALMEIGAGHFARLEFASNGQLCFSFGREIANLARIAVKKAQQKLSQNSNKEIVPFNSDIRFLAYEQQMLSQGNTDLDNELMNAIALSQNPGSQKPDTFSYSQLDNFDMGDFDMENWSALLPSFSPNDMMNLDMGRNVDISFQVP